MGDLKMPRSGGITCVVLKAHWNGLINRRVMFMHKASQMFTSCKKGAVILSSDCSKT